MHPVDCLDRGFSSQFDGEFGCSLAARSTGLIEPDGGLTLSVAIRTIEQQASNLVLGLRSGLVADSVLQDGRQECLLKGQSAGSS